MTDALENLDFRIRHPGRQRLSEIGVLAHFGAQFGRRVWTSRRVVVVGAHDEQGWPSMSGI